MNRSLRWIVAGLPPIALAAVMMRIAWLHNAQGEIHEAGVVHWGTWLGVGLSWFLLLAVPCGVLAVLLHRSSN